MVSNAWISLGGNLGNVKETMTDALQYLDRHANCRVVAVSSIYKTPPWGKTNQPWFLNACAKLKTTLEAASLLQLCLAIEKKMQRKRIEKWGPRTIDIDILFYDNQRITMLGYLMVPHPRISERAFVLTPLEEITPNLLLDGESIARRAERFKNESILKLSIEKPWWGGRGEKLHK